MNDSNSAKKHLGKILGGLLVVCGAAARAQPAAPPSADLPSPDRVILFIIDGLAVGAAERFDMPNLERLMEEGTHYRTMHLPLPGHPEKSEQYPWSCSLPNPMLMSGSPFIGRDGIREAMIQHQFEKDETAFVVNAYSYKDVSGGFGTYLSMPHKPDRLVIDEAKKILGGEDKPAFMRVHLQRTGIQGQKVGKDRYAGKPYYRNIWHERSLYRGACERADNYLGEFVAWMKEQNLWEGTVMLICGDHGQADEGWHEPYSPPSSKTPLVIVGQGVAGGRTFEYCEIFDLAPTIAALAGKEPPPHSVGRVLREAFDPGPRPPEQARLVEQLNEALIAAHALDGEKQKELRRAGFLTLDQLGQWHTTEAGTNFEAFVARQKALLDAHR